MTTTYVVMRDGIPVTTATTIDTARAAAIAARIDRLFGTVEPEPLAHDSYVIEEDGELNVRCEDCPAFVDNIGDQDDARHWAEDHKADPTPYGEPT